MYIYVCVCVYIYIYIYIYTHTHKTYICKFFEVCRLSCPVAFGILVPQPGMEPASPALHGGFMDS